jgi:hypothetical protein
MVCWFFESVAALGGFGKKECVYIAITFSGALQPE